MSKVEKAIRDLWKEQDIPWTKRHRACISVPAIVANSSRRNHADKIVALDAWLLIYDEFVSWFVCLDAILLTTLDRSRNNRREEAAAYLLLTGAILSQLLAIRCLVLSGFDVSARQVVRSLAEYSDVWQLVAFKPAIAKEFVKTEDEEASNAFWHRHLSKGKTKKFLNALRQIHDSNEARRLIEWRAGEEKMLSMAAHPSSIACFAAIKGV